MSELLLGVLLLSVLPCVSAHRPAHVRVELGAGGGPAAVPTGANVTISACGGSARWFKLPPSPSPSPPSSWPPLDEGLVSSQGDVVIAGFTAHAHKGLYACRGRAANSSALLYTCPTNLTHARISSHFREEPSNSTAVEGGVAILRCRAPPSYPRPLLWWTHNGRNVSNTNHTLTLPSGTLYVLGVGEGDEGSYACVAYNPVSHAKRKSRPALLLVEDSSVDSLPPPTITLPPHNVTVVEGEGVVMECGVEGVATPTITWHPLPPSSRVLASGALSLPSLRQGDSGTYTCTASSASGADTAQATLTVVVPPSIISTKTVHNSTFVSLTCTISTSHPASVLWYGVGAWQGEELLDPLGGPLHSTLPLPIGMASLAVYQCLVINGWGCDHREIPLDLSFPPPSIPTTPTPSTPTPSTPTTPTPSTSTSPSVPVFVSFHEKYTLVMGSEVSLTCVARGNPLPDVLWTKGNSNIIPPEDTFEYSDEGRGETTAVAVVREGGIYFCHIFNAHDDDLARATVETILPVYFEEEQVNVTEGSDLVLVCKVREESAISELWWAYGGKVIPGRREMMEGHKVTASELSVGRVSSGMGGVYMCCGGADLCASVTVLVRNKVPPPPQDLQLLRDPLGTSVFVLWGAPPGLWLGPLLGYKLNWAPPGLVQPSALHSTPPTQTAHTIVGVAPDKALEVHVWGYTQAGDGLGAVAISEATVPLAPSQATPSQATPSQATPSQSTPSQATPSDCERVCLECAVLSNATSAKLHIKGSDVAESERLLVRYECLAVGRPVDVPVPAGSRVLHLSRLLPSCKYTFDLRAGGRALATCHLTTPPGQIDVSGLAVWVEGGGGLVRLEWALPMELSGGDGVRVEVTWEEGGVWVDVSGETSYLVGGLDASQDHAFSLRLLYGSWAGSTYISLTAAQPTLTTTALPSPSPSPTMEEGEREGEGLGNLVLWYGVVAGLLVVGCVAVLVGVMILKHWQRVRREAEEGTHSPHRKQHLDTLHRLSESRSSVKSVSNRSSSSGASQDSRSGLVSSSPPRHTGSSGSRASPAHSSCSSSSGAGGLQSTHGSVLYLPVEPKHVNKHSQVTDL